MNATLFVAGGGLIVGLFVLPAFGRRMGLLGMAMLTLPGTIVHEACHWSTAFLLGGKPVRFSLIPRKVDGYWRMGSVTVANATWYNRLPIALAPLMVWAAPLVLQEAISAWFVKATMLEAAGFSLLAGLILQAGVPSRQDWRMALGSPVGVIVYGALLGWGVYLGWMG